MRLRRFIGLVMVMAASVAIATQFSAAEALTRPSKITLNEHGVLLIDGNKVFPLTLTIVPGPDAESPGGRHAYAEFADAGVMFMRSGGRAWNEDQIEKERAMQAAAAANGMRCCPWLGWDLSYFEPGDPTREAKLRRVIDTFKDSPGMGLWKGADEPDWENSQHPMKGRPEQVAHVARLIRGQDPNHPIWLVQAPRGTVESLKRYHDGWDVGGIDIYPISYPPGVHSLGPNKHISMVGDYTRRMREVAQGKPFWMTLQIAFSGVVKPGRTLRFPTFPEQRFMAYQAIANGARGLVYFGGALPQTLNERDKPLGFNWTYFDKVMRPLFEEVGPNSPIAAALIAPDSQIKLTAAPAKPPRRQVSNKAEERDKTAASSETVQDETPTDASGVEFVVREVGEEVYVLACKREGPTVHVRFSGLPPECKAGSVVFEEPRVVEAAGGSFTDWFGPFEVHVYRFRRVGEPRAE